ncbi:hypothetical protein H9P43_003732 [Blastocladiella emersonii ATCC 22665]|nr:hypothetical protein H9P43_003732 [Blastocladiella emersonii ATCC 22665]
MAQPAPAPEHYEDEFDAGLQHARTAFMHMLSAKDHEILGLQEELARKHAETEEMRLRIAQLENQVTQSDKRIAEMAAAVRKLHSFKQQVFESFVEEDSVMTDLMKKAGNLSIIEGDQTAASDSTFAHDAPSFAVFTPSSAPASRVARLSEPRTSIDRAQRRAIFTSPRSSDRKDHSSRGRSTSPTFSLSRVSPTPTASRGRAPTGGYRAHVSTHSPPRSPVSQDSSRLGSTSDAATRGPNVNATQPPPKVVVNGRSFFSRAKQLLPYDKMTRVLEVVKAYNARQQSRQTTMSEAHAVFGMSHPDLFREFELLFSGENAVSIKEDHGTGSGATAVRR